MGLVVAVFVASAVEFVEAFTIVLAMGLTRDWRSAIVGTLLALVALALTVVIAGYALVQWFPESLLQLIIGGLLLDLRAAMARESRPARVGSEGLAR